MESGREAAERLGWRAAERLRSRKERECKASYRDGPGQRNATALYTFLGLRAFLLRDLEAVSMCGAAPFMPKY
jgi:hypothetical protein